MSVVDSSAFLCGFAAAHAFALVGNRPSALHFRLPSSHQKKFQTLLRLSCAMLPVLILLLNGPSKSRSRRPIEHSIEFGLEKAPGDAPRAGQWMRRHSSLF